MPPRICNVDDIQAAGRCPAAAPAVVAQTDLVTILSARMARQLDARLTTLPLPLGPQRFVWTLYWHRRHETQAAHRWIRLLMQEVAREIGATA